MELAKNDSERERATSLLSNPTWYKVVIFDLLHAIDKNQRTRPTEK